METSMKEKNYWPLAIICVLLFGVFMVSVSVTIALKNPVQDEYTYLSTKRDVDERINDIIKEQNIFLASYKPSFFFIEPVKDLVTPREHSLDNFVFPYMTKPYRPSKDKKEKVLKYVPRNVAFRLNLTPIANVEWDIVSVRLFLDSLHQANETRELATLALDSTKPLSYKSTYLVSLPSGRWKFIVEITYDTDKKAYFEHEVFIVE